LVSTFGVILLTDRETDLDRHKQKHDLRGRGNNPGDKSLLRDRYVIVFDYY